MKELDDLVSACFSENGWLVSTKGYRYEPAQEAYAHDVAAWLTGSAETPAALIEGDTGVGKTLAYLIPLFIFVRLTGLRGVVATHTINLQNQMLESDVGIANEYLESCNLIPCIIQQLIGSQAFIDPVKVEYKLSSLRESGYVLSDSSDVVREAYRCSRADGLIESFYVEIGGEPDYLSANDICVDENSESEINLGFERQREGAKLADIVITSHTMLLLNRKQLNSTIFENSDLPIGAIVVDEADLLEAAADMFASRRLHPKQLGNALGKLYEKLTASEKKVYSELKLSLAEFDGELRKLGSIRRKLEPILLSAMKTGTRKNILDRLAHINSLCIKFAYLAKRKDLDAGLMVARDEFNELSNFIARYGSAAENAESTCGINWSDTHGIPSLQVSQAYPAKKIKNYLFSQDRPVCRVMLTSATLSDGRDKGFVNIKACIQLFSDKFYSVQASHSPKLFGTVEFVLTNNAVAQPLSVVSEQIIFDSSWLNHVVATVTEAANNGNTLVLTNSFAESEAITRRLITEKRTHVHRAGVSLKSAIAEFQEHGGILITPSAWEGVSIRSLSGKQLVSQLVITRAPYSPPDKFKEIVLREHLRVNGIGEQKASSIIRAKSVMFTVRKLRQGIGRLIRHYADSGTIWFCDPRIPPYGGVSIHKQDSGLIKAIPMRFMEAYRKALVFNSTKNEISENEIMGKVPSEIEEWL